MCVQWVDLESNLIKHIKDFHDPRNTFKCREESCGCFAKTPEILNKHHYWIHFRDYKGPNFSDDSTEIEIMIDVEFVKPISRNELDQGKFAKNEVSLMIIDL